MSPHPETRCPVRSHHPHPGPAAAAVARVDVEGGEAVGVLAVLDGGPRGVLGEPDRLTVRHGGRGLSRLPARVLRRPAAAPDDRTRARRRPRLVIADEPTTALDALNQKQTLDLPGSPAVPQGQRLDPHAWDCQCRMRH